MYKPNRYLQQVSSDLERICETLIFQVSFCFFSFFLFFSGNLLRKWLFFIYCICTQCLYAKMPTYWNFNLRCIRISSRKETRLTLISELFHCSHMLYCSLSNYDIFYCFKFIIARTNTWQHDTTYVDMTLTQLRVQHNTTTQYPENRAVLKKLLDANTVMYRLLDHVVLTSPRELRMQRFYLTLFDISHVTHFYFPFLYWWAFQIN